MFPLIFISLSFFSSDYDFEDNIQKIENFPCFGHQYISLTYPPPETPFEKLVNYASKQQLKSLLDHPHKMIRAYGNLAYCYRYLHDWIPLAIDKLHDHEVITRKLGCSISEVEMNELFFNWLAEGLEYLMTLEGALPGDREAVKTYRLAIMNLVFSQKPFGNNLKKILTNWDLPETFYERVRALARTGLPEALIALAKYRKPEDAALIAENFLIKMDGSSGDRYLLSATILLPSHLYEQKLTQFHKHLLAEGNFFFEHDLFYDALLANNHPEAPQIMLATLQAIKEKRLANSYASSIYDVLVSNKNLVFGLYHDVLVELWQSYGLLTKAHFDKFWQWDTSLCLELLTAKNYFESEWDLPSGYRFSLDHAARRILESKSPEKIQTLHHLLAAVPGDDFQPFLITMVQRNDRAIVPFLLERLEYTTKEEHIRWTILGLRHLEPDAYQAKVEKLLDQHPQWDAPPEYSWSESKATYIRKHLERNVSFAEAIKAKNPDLRFLFDDKSIIDEPTPSPWDKYLESQ